MNQHLKETRSEQDIIPYECIDFSGKQALVFAPHPDDEVFGCGGAILRHTQAGDKIKVVFLTDGGRGDFTGSYSDQNYTSIRKEEARRACDLLGVVDFEFCDFPDRGLGTAHHGKTLQSIIESYQPEIIYVTSPLELNPDHRATAYMVWAAVKALEINTIIAFYEISTPIHPNALVAISDQMDRKIEAASVYQSQLKYIDYIEIMRALNRFRSLTVSEQTGFAEAYTTFGLSDVLTNKLRNLAILPRLVNKTESSSSPLVSLVVRTLNRPQLLAEALESIAGQDYGPIEAVVVNDGGQDVSGIVNTFSDRLDIQLFNHDRTRGRSAAANTGLDNCQGNLIGFLDDDDLLFPDHVSSLVQFYQNNEGVRLVYSDCILGHYSEGGPEERKLLSDKKRTFKGMDFDRERLLQSNYIPIMTALFDRSLMEQAGKMDESIEILEDWELWIRMSMFTDFKHLPKNTCEYRVIGHREYDVLNTQRLIYKKYWHLCTPEKIIEWLHKTQVENDQLKDRLARIEDRANEK